MFFYQIPSIPGAMCEVGNVFKGAEIERFVEVPAGSSRHRIMKIMPLTFLTDPPILLLAWWVAGLPLNPNDELFIYGLVPIFILFTVASAIALIFISDIFGRRTEPMVMFSEGIEVPDSLWRRIRKRPPFLPRSSLSKVVVRYTEIRESKRVTREISSCTIVLSDGKNYGTGLQDPQRIERFSKVVHDRLGVPVEGAKWASPADRGDAQ
jgi:hypothetical protein